MMYPGTAPDDVATLRSKISDFDQVPLAPSFQQIIDWESGISQEQIQGIVAAADRIDSVTDIRSVTARDTLNLYNLGTYVSVAWVHANRDYLENPESPIVGVCLNPYLISHPLHEAFTGYVPLLYWQGVPAGVTAERLRTVVQPALDEFFEGIEVDSLKLHINSANNCGAKHSAVQLRTAFLSSGFSNVVENDYLVDEVWDLSDGINSPAELVAERLLESGRCDDYRILPKRCVALTPDDLERLSKRFPEFVVQHSR